MKSGAISAANVTQNSSGFLALASGTTAQRPASPTNGMVRYNTDLQSVEGYFSGSWASLSSGSSFLSTLLPGCVSGRYYTTPVDSVVSTTPIATDFLYAIPMWYPPGTVFTRIGLEVTTAVGTGVARLGIYDDGTASGDGPSNLLLDAGTVSVTTTGLKEITISYTCDSNWFWVVVVTNGANPTIRTQVTANGSPVFGRELTTDAAARAIKTAFTYAALPSTYPTGGATITTGAPLLWVRL